MRTVFMGTAELAAPCLEAVAKMPGHEVVAVVTQPDRPKGRDLRPAPPPVKVVAGRLGIPVQQPLKIREPAAIEVLRAARPDLIIVVAYGQILPKSVLEIPRFGCVNVHTSLLPRWRGAAPIQYAILHEDRETGVTTMYMDEHMDTGDIILQRAQLIHADDTSATLHDRLAKLGAELLAETVALIAEGKAPRTKQDETKATYAKKITKEDGRIDWTRPAVEIERRIRAFNPWPSAYTQLGGLMLKIWKAEVVEGASGNPGEVLTNFVVATGHDGLCILELQPANGKRMNAEAFLRGHPTEPGFMMG
ncbi:MAG TPA: methionyl-tRNA formyltransferase [Verrucomicrobiae bacterium]|nr:methionyl-tRNA formyltransferase [Verrucomicrobiae bacterium]